MRKELFFNPRMLLERIAEESKRRRRFAKLKNTPAAGLNEAQIGSLEFFEIIKSGKRPEVIYDLGANAGTWSLLAKTFFPEAVIHAFEPIPAYQEKFMHNTASFKNVFLHKAGAGKEDKKSTMNFAGHSSSFLEISKSLTELFPAEYKQGEVEVEMVALDNYAKKHALPLPDLMKLDVEGYEIEALKGAVHCMANCSHLILEVSFFERHVGQPLFHEVADFLAKHNFRIHSFPINTPLARKITSMDVLFEKVK